MDSVLMGMMKMYSLPRTDFIFELK